MNGDAAGLVTACADDPDLCDPAQACCLAEGACEDLQPSECSERGGSPNGERTTCANNACLEACCLESGVCVDIPFSSCGDIGGNPRGPGPDCANPSCAGACCLCGGAGVGVPSGGCVGSGGGRARERALWGLGRCS